jgi:hypothetical protein
MGHKRTFWDVRPMSALPPEADIQPRQQFISPVNFGSLSGAVSYSPPWYQLPPPRIIFGGFKQFDIRLNSARWRAPDRVPHEKFISLCDL